MDEPEGFYDKMLRDYAGKFGKPFGAKVGTTEIPTKERTLDRVARDMGFGGWTSDLTEEQQQQVNAEWERNRTVRSALSTVRAMDITDAMRDSAMKGLPLFSRAEADQADEGRSASRPFRSDAARTRIVGRLKEIVQQIAPWLDLKTVEGLVDDLGAGSYLDNLATVSLFYGDPETTLRHEIIHALRDRGLIKDAEWKALKRWAETSGWLQRARDVYAGQRMSEDALYEEAIAQGFAEWTRTATNTLPVVRRVFARIRDLLTRLGNALRGMGFTTPESIFEGIEQGEVGRRKANTAYGISGSETARARELAPGDINSPEFKAWFGDSKVVDAGGRPLRVYHGTRADFEVFDVRPKGGLINQMLGAHFAVDPRVTEAFSIGAYARDPNTGVAREDGQTLAGYLRIENPRIIPQRRHANGALDSDQTAIATDAKRIVFRRRPDLFAAWIGFSRATDEATAQRAAEDVLANRMPSKSANLDTPQAYVDEHGGDVLDAVLNNFVGDFGPRIDGRKWGEVIADLYREALQAQGYDGIQYINTSPNETRSESGDERYDPTTFIVFDPAQFKGVTNRGSWSASDPRIRYALGMRRAEVPTHPKLFARLGVPTRRLRADYEKLASKHPEVFGSAVGTRAHVEAVMAGPTWVLPSVSSPWNVALVKREAADRLVAVRFDLRGTDPDYWVRSAYVMREGQLEAQFEAIRRQGGAPELLEFSRLPETNVQSAPPSPRGDSPSDRLMKIARGEIAGKPQTGTTEDPKYSLFGMRRDRSAHLADPDPVHGTAEPEWRDFFRQGELIGGGRQEAALETGPTPPSGSSDAPSRFTPSSASEPDRTTAGGTDQNDIKISGYNVGRGRPPFPDRRGSGSRSSYLVHPPDEGFRPCPTARSGPLTKRAVEPPREVRPLALHGKSKPGSGGLRPAAIWNLQSKAASPSPVLLTSLWPPIRATRLSQEGRRMRRERDRKCRAARDPRPFPKCGR